MVQVSKCPHVQIQMVQMHIRASYCRFEVVARSRGWVYSWRSASIGSRREALMAGYMPKKIPTDAEKPRPIANDHQGSEMGKPDTRWTVQPIEAPSAMPINPPSDVRNAASIRN